jgi:hypothetical protein
LWRSATLKTSFRDAVDGSSSEETLLAHHGYHLESFFPLVNRTDRVEQLRILKEGTSKAAFCPMTSFYGTCRARTITEAVKIPGHLQ